jgi:hypothetical protein
MKAKRGVEVYLHSFLTSSEDGGEWLISRPGRVTPGKNPVAIEQEDGWATNDWYYLYLRMQKLYDIHASFIHLWYLMMLVLGLL